VTGEIASNEHWRHDPMISRLRKLAMALLLAAGLAAGCGGGATPSAGPALTAVAGAADGSPTVLMISDGDARKFEPATLTVQRGTTVTWRHVSGSGHTATLDPSKVKDASRVAMPAGVQPWDSGNLSDGRTWSFTFDIPGTYRYVCLPHEDRGMLGTIVVSG
jgi:plastocyanin